MGSVTHSVLYAPEGAKSADGQTLQGAYMFQRSSGFPQGSPINPMLFCLAIHGCLAELEAQLRQKDPLARVVAYLDDIHILIHPNHMPFALNKATEILARANLTLNHGKCLVPQHTTLPEYLPMCPSYEAASYASSCGSYACYR